MGEIDPVTGAEGGPQGPLYRECALYTWLLIFKPPPQLISLFILPVVNETSRKMLARFTQTKSP